MKLETQELVYEYLTKVYDVDNNYFFIENGLIVKEPAIKYIMTIYFQCIINI